METHGDDTFYQIEIESFIRNAGKTHIACNPFWQLSATVGLPVTRREIAGISIECWPAKILGYQHGIEVGQRYWPRRYIARCEENRGVGQ